ncbi:hypothetical protein BLNAU_1668 [Blattamonas nauphoetae]|uniref:Uncharacterized protein n=1 Tax=Blattamonas nauphoetae TaxID=2049346 RepID=A0ABQ9YHB8_9EUKA|nr:hypothetical protein BLNAU_1668 [Blattamonas nauphoetae]
MNTTNRYGLTEDEEERYKTISREVSKNLWTRMNPGFVDDTDTWTTTSRSTYTSEQFTIMRDPDADDFTNHRKKNEQSEYIEASARQRNMMNLKPTGNNQ